MDINAAFDKLQQNVNASPEAVTEARRRRDLFRGTFGSEDDVEETVPSGSFARGSQNDPINDVDIIVVYDETEHEGWGTPGPSAEEALTHVQDRVKALLGVSEGSVSKEVRLTRGQNHSVKCWLDDPDAKLAFTVDVTPALRVDEETLLIPEKNSSCWIQTAPEHLNRVIAERHTDWNKFVGQVRVVKRWGADQQTEMKSLLLEVLALHHLPKETRSKALARFFAAGASAVLSPVEDPAGLCGEIQPDLDRDAAARHFTKASEAAWRAVEAEDRGETDRAACLWSSIFGDIFPEPPGGCSNGNGAKAVGGAAASVHRRPIRDAPQGGQ